jgi:hypothetical protein
MCSYGSSWISFQCAPRAEATHAGGDRLLQWLCIAAGLPAATRGNVYKTVMPRERCVECAPRRGAGITSEQLAEVQKRARVKPESGGDSVTRGLDHASRIYPTCALKMPEIG